MNDTPRTPAPPALSLILGHGPALLLLALAVGAWLLVPLQGFWLVASGRVWAGAILIFLGGVRRGLSFFTDGGPRPGQVVTSIWLFVAGLAVLLLPLTAAFLLAGAAFLTVAILDPAAARRGEAPAHFARLRPVQMAIFAAGAGVMAAWCVVHNA